MRLLSRKGDEYPAPFLPDAYFEVTYPSGNVQVALVEIDMGTLTLRRFERKVQAFERALLSDVFEQKFKRETFEVYVLTHSWRRLQSLWQVARRVVESDRRGDYFFATFAALEPDDFPDWEWVDLNNETCDGVLFPESNQAECTSNQAVSLP
ncbi:MAG: hypothetical protein JOZ81_26295 [Chloroflexi bacterium]|nr:hypothetical protein [Chloroflexota bacterium]